MIFINIEYLKYLLVINQVGSINKASTQLQTSPQNISRVLQQIEKELGIDLFLRTKQGITFTEHGKLFLEFCQTTIHNFDNFLQKIDLEKSKSEITGKVTIYSSNLLTEIILNDLILKFEQFYPNIIINNIEVDTFAGYEFIQNEPESIGIFCLLDSIDYFPDITAIEFHKGKAIAVVNNKSPFSLQKSVSIHTLMEQKLIFFSKENFEKTESAILLKPYLTEKTKITTTGNLNAYYKFVALGNYICFATEEGFKKQQNPYKKELVPIQISDMVNTSLPYVVITNRKANFSSAQKQWLDFFYNNFNIDINL